MADDETSILILQDGQLCQWEGCFNYAVTIACGRSGFSRDGAQEGHPDPGFYCYAHANKVVDEQAPEYGADCPNCGCEFGIN